MSDQEDNINLDKTVSDDNNQDRKVWNCLGQYCSKTLIVFSFLTFRLIGRSFHDGTNIIFLQIAQKWKISIKN